MKSCGNNSCTEQRLLGEHGQTSVVMETRYTSEFVVLHFKNSTFTQTARCVSPEVQQDDLRLALHHVFTHLGGGGEGGYQPGQ